MNLRTAVKMPPKKRIKPIHGQSTLASFVPVSQSIEKQKDDNTNAVNKDSKQVYNRSFQARWLQLHSWLRHDTSGKMTCQLCINANRENAFTEGSFNYRLSNLDDHVKTNDHKTAVLAPDLRKDIERLQNSNHSDQEKGALVGLKVCYWICKEGIALVKYRSMMNLLRDLKVPNIEHLTVSESVHYDSSYAGSEFIEAMSSSIDKEVTKKVTDSPFVSVLADESTDITVTKRLVIFAQILDPVAMIPATYYLTNVSITECTGEAITNELINELSRRGISMSKVSGLGSDGASVMTGQGKGVAGLLKRKNPHLVNVHCIAHRLALCTSQAAQGIPAMDAYQAAVTAIYYYFKYAPKKVARMEEINKVLDVPALKYKEVHSVRWLSFFEALQTVYRTLDSLMVYLAEVDVTKDPKAGHLKKKIGCAKFVAITHIMMDVIPVISRLTLFFQRENVDVSLIKVNIDHAVTELGKLKLGKGHHEEQLHEVLHVDGSTVSYKSHQVRGCPERDIESAKIKFIEKLIENISQRFPEQELLSAFGALGLRPISFLKGDDLNEWGNDKIEVLIQQYGSEQTHKWKEDKTNLSKSSPAVVDPDAVRAEWKNLKLSVLAQGYPRCNLSELWSLISKYHKEQFPNLIKLAQLALTLPVHTSGCERAFSTQNTILVPLRNRLLPETQNALIRVKLQGQEFVDFDSALNIWSGKKRLLFNLKK